MSRKIPRVTVREESRTPQGYLIKAVRMVTWAGVIVALQIRGYARIGRKPSPEEEADLQKTFGQYKITRKLRSYVIDVRAQ